MKLDPVIKIVPDQTYIYEVTDLGGAENTPWYEDPDNLIAKYMKPLDAYNFILNAPPPQDPTKTSTLGSISSYINAKMKPCGIDKSIYDYI